jgi:hypothetical protein
MLNKKGPEMAKVEKRYIINSFSSMSGKKYESRPLTIAEAIEYFGYTLECGAVRQFERGNKKINRKPSTIKSLISNLNNASNNTYYEAKEFA